MLNSAHLQSFANNGFLVLPGFSSDAQCTALEQATKGALNPALAPLEFEAEVHYPGAPQDKSAPGGWTPRRLLHAFSRDRAFQSWATHADLIGVLRQLLQTDSVSLSQNHHNCIMTKHPGYSSETLWHQDIRYWSFDRPELISVWTALGPETPENGCLHVIPGTHQKRFDRGRFDAALFFRDDLEENQALIQSAQPVALGRGDVLLFHCRLLHAAGRNVSDRLKLSPVFTYRAQNNRPIPHTKSWQYPDIPL